MRMVTSLVDTDNVDLGDGDAESDSMTMSEPG